MNHETYRVWCLSCDEDEARGRDVVGFDPASGGPQPQGCISIPFYNLENAAEAAEAYAEYAHGRRDGHDDDRPLMFRVRKPDGAIEDFEVVRNSNPSFMALRIGA